MNFKAGHILFFSLLLLFDGYNIFDGVFKSPSSLTVKNHSLKEIAKIEILLGDEIQTVDTNLLEPLSHQEYKVNKNMIYTVVISFSDGSYSSQWADLSKQNKLTLIVDENISTLQGINLSMKVKD
jgi:hypothetical protein